MELTKKLNRMLGIRTKLSTVFHPQTDGQTEHMNQELEQYLWFFVDYRQKDWLEWLASAEFIINNKVHSMTKVSLFMANYGRRYQEERKDGKGDRVCGKNEEGTGRSGDSIEKDAGRNEKVCGPK